MDRVKISLGKRSYEIITGNGVLKRCGEILSSLDLGKRVLLVTNPTIGRFYKEIVQKSLRNYGFEVTTVDVPDGEEFKTLREAEKLYDAAFSAGLDRGCPVAALGGGVIGDLAGFVAATYMRGVPLIQMPTTLLAQVDSSVGGKVAVNHPRGKNIIGSFYQPAIVLTDLNVLDTLPARELRAGLAEVIKYGIIKDQSFFEWLEDNLESMLKLDYHALEPAIKKSCRIKARIVEKDETEQGIRAILNFGHTVGHALETLTGYKAYRHGEAVSVGMVFASRLAGKIGMLENSDQKRIEQILVRAGLPVKIPGEISIPDIISCFYSDKKVLSGQITFVLPERIGRVRVVRDLPEREIIDTLQEGGRFCAG